MDGVFAPAMTYLIQRRVHLSFSITDIMLLLGRSSGRTVALQSAAELDSVEYSSDAENFQLQEMCLVSNLYAFQRNYVPASHHIVMHICRSRSRALTHGFDFYIHGMFTMTAVCKLWCSACISQTTNKHDLLFSRLVQLPLDWQLYHRTDDTAGH